MINKNFKIITENNIKILYKKRKKNLDNKVAQKIEQIWNNFLIEKKLLLFNGSLLNFVKLKKNKNKTIIYGEFIDYKTFIAHRESSNLRLNIHLVSVSGITIIREKNKKYIVFAKRKNVTQYKDYFETVPSGDIEEETNLQNKTNKTIDYKQQIIKEFEQETKLPKKTISSINTLGIVFDKKEKNYDVCCVMDINSTKKQFKKAIKNSKEYYSVKFVEENKLEDFIKSNYSFLVPTSIGIVKLYILKTLKK